MSEKTSTYYKCTRWGDKTMKPTYQRFEALVDALMMAIQAKSEHRSLKKGKNNDYKNI